MATSEKLFLEANIRYKPVNGAFASSRFFAGSLVSYEITNDILRITSVEEVVESRIIQSGADNVENASIFTVSPLYLTDPASTVTENFFNDVSKYALLYIRNDSSTTISEIDIDDDSIEVFIFNGVKDGDEFCGVVARGVESGKIWCDYLIPPGMEFGAWVDEEATIVKVYVDPEKYALTYGQTKVFTLTAYRGENQLFGRFEIGDLVPMVEGVDIRYPFNYDTSKLEVKMPYQQYAKNISDFKIPVSISGGTGEIYVDFYGSSPYTPGAGISGGAGVPSGVGGGGGSLPSDPGPSLVDRIPNGQTGNDIAQSGLFTMYLMNQQYMTLMGEILWEDNIGIQAAKEIFGNPINTVISTISYPFNLLNLVQYSAQNLYFGQWKTDLIFQALTKSSFQIDWGTISIPFAWGNFLDYAPHTKMELFLPWGPGYVTIDPNEVSPFSNEAGNFNVGSFTAGSIQVKTNIELGKGTCVHNVIGNNGRVIGSYSGIVGKQVPITALDTGGKILTTVAAVATGSVGLATSAGAMSGKFNTGQMMKHKQIDPLLNRPLYADAGYMQKASEGVSGIDRGANLASSALISHPITFPRAGTFSDGSSAMTVQTPFLIISRPVQSVPTQYGHYNGYPSNIHYFNFSNISGYTEISEIHLDNVTATADELQELDAILKGGILL